MGYSRRPGLAGPLILIGVGVLILLSNLGLLPYGLWSTLWRLWPLVLVLIGLDMLFGRRSALGSLLVFGLTAAIALGVVYWAWVNARNASAQIAEPQALVQSLREATAAEVQLDFGVGRLNVHALSGSAYLMEGTAINLPGQVTEVSYSVRDGVGRLEVDQSRSLFAPSLTLPDPNVGWDLGFNAAVPITLTVDTGAGRANIDLAGLDVRALRLDSGVGQTSVIFPGRGRLQAVIRAGVGEVTLTIPADLPARISLTTGLGSTRIDSRFGRQGNVYQTADFSTAGDYLEIELRAGVGSVIVK